MEERKTNKDQRDALHFSEMRSMHCLTFKQTERNIPSQP